MTYVYFYCPRTWLRLRCCGMLYLQVAACSHSHSLHTLVCGYLGLLLLGIECVGFGFVSLGLVWVLSFYFICISPWKESLLFLWIEILPFWCFSACFMLFLRNLVSKKGISLWLFLNISAWPIQQALDYYMAF